MTPRKVRMGETGIVNLFKAQTIPQERKYYHAGTSVWIIWKCVTATFELEITHENLSHCLLLVHICSIGRDKIFSFSVFELWCGLLMEKIFVLHGSVRQFKDIWHLKKDLLDLWTTSEKFLWGQMDDRILICPCMLNLPRLEMLTGRRMVAARSKEQEFFSSSLMYRWRTLNRKKKKDVTVEWSD